MVCQNTLAFAFTDLKSQRRKHLKVDHMTRFDAAAVQTSLGLIDNAWSDFMARVNPMAAYAMSDKAAQDYFESLFLSDQELEEFKPTLNAKSREVNQIMGLFKSARGQDLKTARGTLWGAVNAVTHYTDHVRSPKSAERLDSAWFGMGASLKEKAWERATGLLGMEQAA